MKTSADNAAVLIVDDDPQIVETVARILSTRAIRAIAAHDPAEALTRLAADPDIAVVLTDINMPGGSGLDLADRIGTIRDDASAVELIFITGDGTAENAVHALRRKAFDFLPKPFRMTELIDVVERARAACLTRRERALRSREVERQIDAAHEQGQRLASHLAQSMKTLARTQAALSRAEEVRENLFAVISHELRTPLIPILGFSDIILSSPDLPRDSLEHMVGAIRAEGGRLLDLIETALDILVLQQDGALRTGPASPLRPILDAVAAEARSGPLAREKRIAVTCDGADVAAACDARRVRRAAAALVDNAIKASPPDETVRMALAEAGPDAVSLVVSDRGPGPSDAIMCSIGVPFMQGDMSYTRAWSGAGLGLAFVDRVARAHGGTFALTRGQTGGAVAIMTLPRRQTPAR
ncbi:MAG: response regulator [Rubrimonas sp.]